MSEPRFASYHSNGAIVLMHDESMVVLNAETTRRLNAIIEKLIDDKSKHRQKVDGFYKKE